VTDHDFGDDQEPLLVRPFVLESSESPDDDPSTQTWPSATTRETRSRHASAGEPPTQVVPRPAAPHRHRRRLLVIGGVGAAVVLAATAAAFAALRPDVSPSVASDANASLPVVTGPAPSASAPVAPPSGSPSATTHNTRHPSAASARASASRTPSSGTPSASVPSRVSPSAATSNTSGTGFGPHNVAPAGERTGTIRGQNGLCLDLTGALPFDDNRIQVFDCNGTNAQTWTLATDGTLRVMGKCALIVGDNSVRIVACDGRTTAQWQASDSLLVNKANGKCLTDPSGGSRAGTPVVVSTCGGSAGQRWSLP
jgi:ricin-type beta-trefoil lectin protein